MKMKVRVNDQLIVLTPDTGAAISIISFKLAQQLGLTPLPTPLQKIQTLNSQTQVIGVIEDAPIKIQQAKVPIHLRVVESAKLILLLGMDWHKKYQVMINVSEQTLEFTTQGQRYRTVVEYEKEPQVNNLKCFWTEIIDLEEEADLIRTEDMQETIAYMAQSEMKEETDDPFLEKQKQKLLALFPDIVFQNEKSATITPLVHCKLYLKHDRPIRDGTRALGFHKREWLRKEIDELLKAGIIRPPKSPHAAAPVIVQKKDGTYRLAIDYRRVNEATEDFLYPLPKIAEIFDCFAGAKWFTTLDLARGYWQIAIDPKSLPYTSFITPFGQYEFLVMPFGLKQ